MKVLVPKLSGFCPGVKRAVHKLLEFRNLYPQAELFINGYLINNKQFINFLKCQRIFILDEKDVLPPGTPVFIRTHGIAWPEEERLKKRYRLIDLTCANVKRVQQAIQRHAHESYFTIIVGARNHPEIIGLISYAQKGHVVVEKETELESLKTELERQLAQRRPLKLFLCTQTTGVRELFMTVADFLQGWIKENPDLILKIFDSICPITEKKEAEALRLQKKATVTFVLGDRLSANAQKLYQVLKSQQASTYFVENLSELISLNLLLSKEQIALVVSSASTPSFIEDEVVKYLAAIGKD